MSADNVLVIVKTKNGYGLADRFIESQEPIKHFFAETKTLEEAIKKANKYMEENIVEYGLRILIK